MHYLTPAPLKFNYLLSFACRHADVEVHTETIDEGSEEEEEIVGGA